jgi:hypothetical protein
MIVLFFFLCIVLGLAIAPFVIFSVHRITSKKIKRMEAIRDTFMFMGVLDKQKIEAFNLYQEAGELYAQVTRIGGKRVREIAKALMDDIRELRKDYASNKQ